MFASRTTRRQLNKTHALCRESRAALSLVEDEKQKGNITLAQGDAFQRYLTSVYVAAYLHGAFEPFVERFTRRAQRRLMIRSDDLIESLLHMAEE